MSDEGNDPVDTFELTDELPPEPTKLPGGASYVIADREYEIRNGDGVMRAEPGFYVVTDSEGVIHAMPPARFAEAYPQPQPKGK